MSSRHRREALTPPPSERRVHHHRERQALRHALDASDPEDLVDPRSRHSLHDEHPRSVRPRPSPSRFRHWKAPFWKRRTAARHERNAALAAFAASDLPAGPPPT